MDIARRFVVSLLLVHAVLTTGCGSDSGSEPASRRGNAGAGGAFTLPPGFGTGAAANTPQEAPDSPPPPGEIGALPDPLAVDDAKNVDATASAVAAASQAWTSDGLAGLEEAMLLAGYTIKNGTDVIRKPDVSNGIAIQAFDIQAAKVLLDGGTEFPLTELAAVLNGALDGVTLDFVGTAVDGVDAARSSNVPTLQYWAALMTEFGRQASTPHDWKTATAGSDIMLSPPELLLLFTRMAADMYSWVAKQDGTVAAPAPSAGSSNIGQARQADSDPSLPCQLSDKQSFILDANATGTGIAANLILSAAEDHGFAGAGKYGNVTTLANLLGAYVKLAWSLAALTGTIEFSKDPQQLTRTTGTAPGERKELTVTARFDIGHFQWANCIRPALNALGFDFSLPNDGPIAGATVKWKILRGGTTGGSDPTFGYLQWADGANISMGKTDDQGKATVDLDGAPQRVALKDPKPVKRRGKVRADFVLKPADFWQDVNDAVNAGAGAWAGIAASPAEMLYRTDLLFGVSKTIPVIDWSMGTLHFEEKASVKTMTLHPGPPLTTTETVTAEYDDIRDYIVTDGKGAQVFGMLEGIVTLQAVTLEGHEKYELTSHTAGACITEGDPLGDEVTDDHFVRDLMGQGVLDAPVSLSIQGKGNRYLMTFAGLGYPLTGTQSQSHVHTDPCNPQDDENSPASPMNVTQTTRTTSGTLDGVYDGAFQGEKYYTGEVTVGDQTLKTEVTVNWDISIPIERP